MTKSQQQYIQWMRVHEPQLYSAAVRVYRQEQGLGEASNEKPTKKGFFSTLLDTAKEASTSWLEYRQQRDLNKLELQRQRVLNAQPPANVNTNGGTSVPQHVIDALVTKVRENPVRSGLQIGLPGLLGAGALAYFLFKK